MNDLKETILQGFPGAEFSCRGCGSHDVKAEEHNGVSQNNPLGDRIAVIYCVNCGMTDEQREPDKLRETIKAWLVKEVTVYTCSFEFFFNGTNIFRKLTEIPRLNAVTGGFWVNDGLKFVDVSDNPDDCVYWVPESRILSIKKNAEEKRLG